MLSRIVSQQRSYYESALKLDDIPNEINAMIVTFTLDAFIEVDKLVDINDRTMGIRRSTGELIERRTNSQNWCIGRVKQIFDDGKVLVGYVGWADKWSEILPESSPRLAEFGSQIKLDIENLPASNYSAVMSIQASQNNLKYLMQLGYADKDQLVAFFERNGSAFVERNNIVNVLVYWRLMGKSLYPSLTQQLENLHIAKTEA